MGQGTTAWQGINGAQEQVTRAVLTWEGMAVQPHRFGGVEYLLGTREIGHIHGDYLVDIPFPTKVRTQLIEAGRVKPHHIFPESGWISFYIRMPEDVDQAIELLRTSYAIAAKQKGAHAAAGESPSDTAEIN